MHIPQTTTDALPLELFTPALEAALRPSPEYDVSRWLYVPSTYSDYRYILGTRGAAPLICVGLNPSTAAPKNRRSTAATQPKRMGTIPR